MVRNYKSAASILTIMLTGSACETTGEKFQQKFQGTIASVTTPSTEKEMRRLTKDGKTFPNPQELTRVISKPGDLPGGEPCPPAARKSSLNKSVAKGKSPFRKNVTNSGTYGMYSYSLKRHKGPRRGCLPVENVSKQDAIKALASQNLTYRAGSGHGKVKDSEVRALGAAILSVQYLNGGPLAMGKPAKNQPNPLPIEFRDQKGSQQKWEKIEIGRSGHMHYGTSVAQHVHEWAHLIGNNGGYEKFRKEVGVPPYCNVSGYSANNPKNSRRKEFNEHFAEVLTAFVTEPASLKNHSNKACKKAFEFFRKFFKKGDRYKECM